MSNPRYHGWSRMGFAYKHQTSLTTTYQVFALTTDATNAPTSLGPPGTCWLEDLSIEIDTIASSAAAVRFYLCRDLAGDRPLTPEAVQTILTGKTTAAKGGVNLKIERDYHNEGIAGVDVADTVHIAIRLDAGTCKGNIRLNWKA